MYPTPADMARMKEQKALEMKARIRSEANKKYGRTDLNFDKNVFSVLLG